MFHPVCNTYPCCDHEPPLAENPDKDPDDKPPESESGRSPSLIWVGKGLRSGLMVVWFEAWKGNAEER